MSGREIDQLIIKFLTSASTSQELDVLNQWINTPGNEPYFRDFVQTHFAISLSMDIPDTEKVKNEFIAAIRKDKRREKLRKCYQVLKYAAVVLIVVGGGYWMYHNQAVDPKKPMDTYVESLKNQVTLQLGNGSVVGVTPNQVIKTLNGDILSDSTTLLYAKGKGGKALFYNKLMVPYGKKYNIHLSDGSFVRLNSGSSLLFPVDFVKGDQRKVYLQGEAYFQISHDKKRPFYVSAEGVDVKVYGTNFNVKNYSEEREMEVVLVEGSVSLIADNQLSELRLTPGDMGSFDKLEKKSTKRAVDTSIYTSWINGNMIFRDEPFKNIILELQRSYNVHIENHNHELGLTHFNAIIETEKESIQQVLNYFSKIYPMTFAIDDTSIIIN